QYFAVASHVLSSGATYVLCWGRECAAAENVFDEAIVGSAGEFQYGEVVTTSHEGESLCNVLEFATSGAVSPDLDGATLVVVMVGAGWYGEAHNCLEDLLESKLE